MRVCVALHLLLSSAAALLVSPPAPALSRTRAVAARAPLAVRMNLVLTEENAQSVLEECQVELGTMFGSNAQSTKVGITGVRPGHFWNLPQPHSSREPGAVLGVCPRSLLWLPRQAVEFVELDGPTIVVRFTGRFWHKRTTVLERVESYVLERIPECIGVEIDDPADLDDADKLADPADALQGEER